MPHSILWLPFVVQVELLAGSQAHWSHQGNSFPTEMRYRERFMDGQKAQA